MKEAMASPPTVPFGFGCTCTSEKVIFCFNKRTGQKTWSCSGKCFEASEIVYSPPMDHYLQNTSHKSSATQTHDEPDQPTAAKPMEGEADTSMTDDCQNAESIPPSSSMQYILSGNVVYCVSQAIHVDLEPVPVVDKPEGVHYNDEDDKSRSEMDVEQDNDKDGDDGDVVERERRSDKTEFMCIVCGKVFKRKGFLTRHLKNHQKDMEGNQIEIQQQRRNKNEDEDEDDDDDGVNDDKLADDDGSNDDVEDDDDDDYVANDEDNNSDDDDDDDEEESQNDDTLQSNKKPSPLKRKSKERNKVTLQCEFCEKAFTNKTRYDKHVQAHSRPEPRQCKQCVMTFKSDKSLESHVKKHSEEELNCFFCPQVVRSRFDLEKHILIHPKQKSLKCDTCQKAIKSVYLFAKHLAKHKNMKCVSCEIIFKTEKQLKNHQKVHESDNPLDEASGTPEVADKQCQHCEKVCTASEYRSHVYRAHRKKKVPQGPLECTYCGKLSDGRSAHVRHLRVHTKEKPFKCSFGSCEKAFAVRGDLIIHVRRHTGDRPFKCDRCDKAFVKKWNLDEHLRTHTGAKPYKCDFCEKSFGFRNVLKVHLAQHTGEKRFKCPHCDNRYVKEVLLKMHLVSHSGEKPYKCLHCEKAFIYKSGLTEHLRMHKM